MKNNESQDRSDKLRQRAEKLLKKKLSKSNMKLSEEEMEKLIYELEVHQIELELQNEELKSAQAKANSYTERYQELYDFAPIGYLSLSKEGAIMEINLCATQMLNKERTRLQNSLLGFFVSEETKPIFNHFLWNVFTSGSKVSCEVTLNTESKRPINVCLIGIISSNQEQCLVTLSDITDQKRAEEELKKWATLFQPKSN